MNRVLRTVGLNTLRKRVADGFRAREWVDPLVWMPWNVRFPQTWEATAFDFEKAPHVRGLLERFINDPKRRKANLMWASRCCKTSTVLSLISWIASVMPATMAILFPDRGTLDAALDEHIYPMMEAAPALRKQLRPRHQRNRKAIHLDHCRVRLANAGTKSDSSGYPARFVFKIEHDKCPVSKSSEADASKRIESRAAGYARGVKILEEGTPSEVGTSRVDALLKSKTVMQLRYQVPCPHCGHYQPLDFERVKWQRNELGESEPMLAERTAIYECAGCEQSIENHHRVAMMQAGHWLADGEWVEAGRICGEPKVDSNTMVFGPFSSLYSLFIAGWGEVAREFVQAVEAQRNGDLEALRKFKNEVLAEVWTHQPLTVPVNELAEHLRGDHQRGECPKDTAFVVTAADVGAVGQTLIFHWMTVAWAAGCQGAAVDWGIKSGEEAFLKLLESTFPVQGRPGWQIPIQDFPIGLDSSAYTNEVYALSELIPNAVSMKGDSATGRLGAVDFYSMSYKRADSTAAEVKWKRVQGLVDLMMVSTELSQQWRVSLTERRIKRGGFGFLSLPYDVCDQHQLNSEVFRQLVSDQKIKNEWKRTGKNEAGDLFRYARVLGQYFTNNGDWWNSVELPPRYSGERVAAASAVGRRDRPAQANVFGDQPFLISQR